jgi:hypothetical protein
MRKTLGIFLLVLLLTGSVSAGEMGNDSPAPPPPQSATAIPALKPDDEMQDGVAASLTQITLNVLAVLPSLH